MTDFPIVRPNVLKPAACDYLIELYEANKAKGSQRSYSGAQVVHYWDLLGPGRQCMRDMAQHALTWARTLGATVDGFPTLYIESCFVAKLSVGEEHELHIDNVKLDGVTPNHTPQRAWSSLFYLNGDFEGGELCFPMRVPPVRVKPTRGMFVLFPSGGRDMAHEVKPVTAGARYSTAVWFTRDIERALFRPQTVEMTTQ